MLTISRNRVCCDVPELAGAPAYSRIMKNVWYSDEIPLLPLVDSFGPTKSILALRAAKGLNSCMVVQIALSIADLALPILGAINVGLETRLIAEYFECAKGVFRLTRHQDEMLALRADAFAEWDRIDVVSYYNVPRRTLALNSAACAIFRAADSVLPALCPDCIWSACVASEEAIKAAEFANADAVYVPRMGRGNYGEAMEVAQVELIKAAFAAVETSKLLGKYRGRHGKFEYTS